MLFHRPPDSAVARAARIGLSPALLAQARSRLKRLMLVMSIVVTVLFGVTVSTALLNDQPSHEMVHVLIGSFVTMVVVVGGYLALRSRALRDDLAVWLGFGLEIFTSLSAALGNYVGFYADVGNLPMIPWTVGVMLVFPLVVPRPARLTLLLALMAGACIPGAAVLLEATGEVTLRPGELFELSLNAITAVGIAYFTSRIAYGLSVDADKVRQMGSYHLEEKLGAGGMGEVWRARHELLARPAAVKLIHSSDDSGHVDVSALQRFEREAQATASLKSPHTIQIYDFGFTESQSFYYVMELIDGVDLQQLVERHGPLPAHRAVHLLIQICHSLHEAHLTGLVHRDIKPANLFTCRHGAELDFVKVLDFGLVKETEAVDFDGEAGLTAQGIVVGTPAYMAPEMALRPSEVDGRSDIYALGCVAYWLLTGTTVFPGGAPMRMLVAHVNETPQPPSERSELTIPDALDRLVLACLAKDPAERPASAEELDAALRSVRFEADWTAEDARRWWDIHRPGAR